MSCNAESLGAAAKTFGQQMRTRKIRGTFGRLTPEFIESRNSFVDALSKYIVCAVPGYTRKGVRVPVIGKTPGILTTGRAGPAFELFKAQTQPQQKDEFVDTVENPMLATPQTLIGKKRASLDLPALNTSKQNQSGLTKLGGKRTRARKHRGNRR